MLPYLGKWKWHLSWFVQSVTCMHADMLHLLHMSTPLMISLMKSLWWELTDCRMKNDNFVITNSRHFQAKNFSSLTWIITYLSDISMIITIWDYEDIRMNVMNDLSILWNIHFPHSFDFPEKHHKFINFIEFKQNYNLKCR